MDFWIREICEYHRKKKNLSLSSRDIKGKNEIQAHHKYLSKYAGLNLDTVEVSYKQLDDLRKVRNTFIHGGGHVPNGREDEFSAINGIVLSMSLLVVENNFIWSMLEHAKKYLQAAVRA